MGLLSSLKFKSNFSASQLQLFHHSQKRCFSYCLRNGVIASWKYKLLPPNIGFVFLSFCFPLFLANLRFPPVVSFSSQFIKGWTMDNYSNFFLLYEDKWVIFFHLYENKHVQPSPCREESRPPWITPLYNCMKTKMFNRLQHRQLKISTPGPSKSKKKKEIMGEKHNYYYFHSTLILPFLLINIILLFDVLDKFTFCFFKFLFL